MRFAGLLFLLLLAGAARAQEFVTLDRLQHPALLYKTSAPGVFVEAPSVSTDISLSVRGIVARGVVRQRFENTTTHCVEAVYAFPLPDNATVDAMRLRIGDRTITGEIREREEATRVYEQAKREGRNASLLEQQRPNLFTVSVASLAAGSVATIELEYQQIVEYQQIGGGQFSLRLPLAIGPRYKGAALPHVLTDRDLNPVSLTIDLDAGIALEDVTSRTHALEQTVLSATRIRLEPRDVRIASDRDFELAWTPRLGALPQSASFTETVGGERYTLLMLFPPDVSARPAAILPRETIFIIDTSGSMGGPSIEQAKQALLTAVERLRPSDRFNVIEFNSSARALFQTARVADKATIREALEWVGALESTGGTEMLGALQLALAEKPTADAIRQIIFITDGQVGNEAQIFEFIRANLSDRRLFTIGIGNAPNTYFMRNAARAGRGTFTHIGDVAEVETRMTALLTKLGSPVLADIAIAAEGELSHDRVPDLYAGEPLILTMRAPAAASANGRITADGWNSTFTLASDASPGIAKLWARQKIDTVRDRVFTGANAAEVKQEIVQLALTHHLVTEHTSLVAVDTTPPGVDPKSCTSELVPVNLPANWGEGMLPRTATHATRSLLNGLALLLAALIARKW
ncbi:MAG TPA: VIT domain-containing protein [Thermoanaerobaculia bacterium]